MVVGLCVCLFWLRVCVSMCLFFLVCLCVRLRVCVFAFLIDCVFVRV